jgi:hypothetical protein
VEVSRPFWLSSHASRADAGPGAARGPRPRGPAALGARGGRGGNRHRGVAVQLTGVVATLGVAALSFAQTSHSQTSPGTMPVPKPGVEKAAPAGTTPVPSKATAKKTEPIQSTFTGVPAACASAATCPSPKPRPVQRGASSSARRPRCTGNRTFRKPERIAPCRLRSLRDTLTRRGGCGATASSPRRGLVTQGRLSDGKHRGVGAPGGTRTPGIRLRRPPARPVFSGSCGMEGTLEDTRRLVASIR